MAFFAAKLSKNGNRLSWGMSPILRGGLIFAFVSVAGMIVFSLTASEYAALSIIGKINVVVLPILLLFGSIYEYRVTFDKAEGSVEIRKGLFFLPRREKYEIRAVQRLVVRTVRPGRGNLPENELMSTGFRLGRVFIGFLISGRMIVLDRACSFRKARGWIIAFRAFIPFQVEEGE